MRTWPLLALVIVQGFASPAFAQPEDATPSPAEVAIQKGREGIGLYQKGDFEGALTLFRESDAVYHSPVFVVYAARSHRNLGRLIEARSLYLTLTREKLEETAPTTWRQAQIDGATELAALDGEIPILVVTAKGATPATLVKVDEIAVAVDARTQRNPGDHRVVVEDRGRTLAKTVTLARGAAVSTVAFDLTRPDGEIGPPEDAAVDAWRVFGAVLTAVGGAGLVAGGIVGGIALDQSSQAGQGLPRTCSPDRSCLDTDEQAVEARFQSAYTPANAADGLLIGGGIAAAVGVLILILDPGGATVVTAPSVGAGGFAIRF